MNRRYLIGGGIAAFVLFIWIISSVGHSQPPKEVKAAAPGARELYAKAVHFRKNRDLIKAREAYKELLINHGDIENAPAIQKELEDLNMDIILSNEAVPEKTVTHEVVSGDTLGKLAKQYNTTVDLIKKNNNLKSDVIRVGQKLRIWTGTFNILVDKSQNILILKDGNEVIKVYDVSTGEESSTPVGEFTIVSKLVDPVWFNRGMVVPPESPENVLGTRWLGFDFPGYGIHGTVEPETIGQQVTAGCVRMLNKDVEELYNLVPSGTKVSIVN